MPPIDGASSDKLTEVARLYRAGEFAECHAILDQIAADSSAQFHRVEVFFREHRHEDAIKLLLDMGGTLSQQEETRRSILIGAAYSYCGDYGNGARWFEKARASVGTDRSLLLELAHHRGNAAWALHDDQQALSDAAILESCDDATYRGLGLFLHSWVDVRRGDAATHARRLLQALNAFEKAPQRDEYRIARALYTLAVVCREMKLPKATSRLKSAVQCVAWSRGMALEHYHVTRQLGWIEALSGNELAAFRLLKQSAALAPSNAWRVLSLLDRAKLARSNGEESFVHDQLQEAQSVATEIKWSETHNEERSALLIFAELFAQADPKIATAYLEKFRSLPSVDGNLAYASDRRVNAFAAYSAGIAHKQLGNGAIALAALTDAWETFEQYGYGWRSALAAAEVYELTGARTWLTRAQHAIAPWADSWIARKIAKLDAEKLPTARLTFTQRRVYDALLEGSSTKDIAEKLGRSPNTIRNHIAAVFIAFRVKSRAQLLAATFAMSNLKSAQQHSISAHA
ncbi:MAG: response regulator transcription factor [Candidatus Eremiobacteraeota bacterium]|nr:response regulator transcription factor [Candidatus Eremiobacteraeota bacterium]